MTRGDDTKRGITRRSFLQDGAATTLALGAGGLAAGGRPGTAVAQASGSGTGAAPGRDRPYNILFLLTDQERYFEPGALPPGFELPGRRRLEARGVTFTNHQINSAVCTPSRSVIYTGRHIQQTRMFDNMDFPWTVDLSREMPNMGSLLAQAGYYAAYKGKWHLSKSLGTHDELALPQEALTEALRAYGFKDYVGIGDIIGMVQGGYINDETIGTQARRWLRLQGQRLNREGKPWALAVNLVNPHDVMFYNTDVPGQHVQDRPAPLLGVAREPDVPAYRRTWDVRLPRTRNEPFDRPGRPRAHGEYQAARGALVGNFPNEDARWERLLNYYFNCMADADRVVDGVLDELVTLGLADDTVIVATSDHGELAGAHGTHGKGATAYREQNHVPLVIAHPAYPETRGQRSAALTSHLDLLPSMLAWTGHMPEVRARLAGDLPGKDLTPLLARGETAEVNALRAATLYCFNMWFYVDAGLALQVQAFLNGGGRRADLPKQGFRPDLTKRGAIRSVFDGRYKFSRYFSPRAFNQPTTLEGMFDLNDLELFDLENDPYESRNLATKPEVHGDLLLAMNQTMNAMIETEVGEPDDGRFLPGDPKQWAAERFDP